MFNFSKLEIPIIQAPMAGGINNPKLASEVTNAGGVGSFGFAYSAPQKISEDLVATRALTKGPINANFFVFSVVDLPSQAIQAQATEMKRFLFKNLYRHPQVTQVTQDAADMVRSLFNHYRSNSQVLPDGFRAEDSLERRIAHYIAGMTDRYAVKEFKKIA